MHPRVWRRFRSWLPWLILALSLTAHSATYTVTTTTDSGNGSFRWALTNANSNPGLDHIHFNIPADVGEVKTIFATSLWPAIIDPVIIDGYTQPGAAANNLAEGNDATLLVQLSTATNLTYGLRLNTRDSVIRGLIINGFITCISLATPDSGIGGNNIIEGNFVGLNAAGNGTNAIRRSNVGIEVITTNNVIGGTVPAARNVISWTSAEALRFLGGGNYNTIQGNYIGTDRDGLNAVPNYWGIQLGGSHHNQVGGSTPEARNLISGNTVGIIQTSETGHSHTIQGNFIGLDVTGLAALPNGTGMMLGGPNNVVGGSTSTPGSPPGNVISGNSQGGISIVGSGVVIQGNVIGADATGTWPLPNGSFGVALDNRSAVIGGNAGSGNIIGGNADSGVRVNSDSNLIMGNWIGTDPSGTLKLGNGAHGIRIASMNNRIEANAIAYNGTNGVAVIGLFGTSNNWITANSFYGNGHLGIDLGTNTVPDGVDSNDVCDADYGAPNQRQNYPVLTMATNTGSDLLISGFLNSEAGSRFVVEFFASPQCDPIGYGEGNVYLGSELITIGMNCGSEFAVAFAESVLPRPIPPCWVITATAYNITNRNTSEFSACQLVLGPPNADLQLSVIADPAPVTVNSNLTYILQVANQGPCAANGVQLQHFLGEGTTFITGDGCAVSGGFVTCDVGFLAPGDVAQRSLVVSYGFVGNAGATFVAVLDETDPNYDDNTVSINTVVDGNPIVVVSPTFTNVVLGASVTFCAEVGGPGPVAVQWRRNGVNLPGETNLCIHIDAVQLSHGGTYTVLVGNPYGAVVGPPALLTLDLPALQGADEFNNRTDIGGFGGFLVGKNVSATVEPTEPRHSGKPGGRSVWYSWVSPNTGIATFRTVGSSFDTLLAIYVECSESNLLEIASDDDRGTNLTSFVQFNALAGTNYLIAVDGFDGATGDFALTWVFEQTTSLLPVILNHPGNTTLKPGATATFSVAAIPGCLDSHHGCGGSHGSCTSASYLEYQWLFNGFPIAGAVLPDYSITVSETNIGNYSVRISQGARSIESRPASLQVNATGNEILPVQAHNKFGDAAEAAGIELGGFTLPPPPPRAGIGLAAAVANTVVRGYTGTHIFNTIGSSTEPSDQLICNVLGGASQWITFVPLESGVLHLNTDGSTYNTLMAVFRRSLANPAILQLIDCDNNGGQDGRDSALSLPVESGVTNFVMIDGVNGATGILHLNYSLVTSTTLSALGPDGLGQPQFRLTGHPDMHFSIETSLDMFIWLPLFTTNSAEAIFEFTDTSPNPQHRFYRAVMLP